MLQSAGTGGGAAAISAAVAPAVPATVKEIIGASGAVRSSAKLYDDYRTAKKTLNDPLAKGNDKAVAVLDVATDTLALAGSITLVQQNLKQDRLLIPTSRHMRLKKRLQKAPRLADRLRDAEKYLLKER